MLSIVKDYTHWLHGQWPDGTTEKLPELNDNGQSSIKGVYVVGDLTGIPLLKFSADSGAKAVKHILKDADFKAESATKSEYDLVIIGGGVSGYAAAIEAKAAGINFVMLEASQSFSTIANFPKGKPIYTYPTDMTPEGQLTFSEDVSVKEKLLTSLQHQAHQAGIEPKIAIATSISRNNGQLTIDLQGQDNLTAKRIIVAIGRAGKHKKLDVQGEENAINRLHDPADYKDKKVVIVGGGDSAVESALAIADAGAEVTLSYRQKEFTRPKPENIDKLNQAKSEGKAEDECWLGTCTVVTH